MFAFVVCAATAMADAVVAFGTNNDGRAFTAQTILAGVNGWESDVLPDGNKVAITQEPAGTGKFWNAQAVMGTWENEEALAALNEFSGITFTAADMSEGTSLKVAANSNAAVNAILNLILDAQNEGDLVTLYTTVSGWNCPLDEITVTGLDNCVIKYAPGDGGGFYETPAFTQVNQGLNLIVITGNLTADKHVTVTSPTLMNSDEKTKVGFQIAAYKVTAGETPVNIESLAVVGTFPGMTWEPTEGVAMTQDSENPAIWTVTMNDVNIEGIKYEYKVTANGKWGDYEIPEQGNQDFVFGTDAYPAGTYNITFTADTENHTLAIEPVLVPQEEDAVYTITGCTTDHPRYGTEEAGFFGTAWDATIAANNMEKGADGLYTKTFENVYVNPPFYIKYQVVKNQTEAIGEKATFTAQTGGMYNVVFTFNPEDNSVTCELQSNVEPEPVYTLVGGVNTTEGGQEDVLFGTTWEPTLEANDMEKGADGIYTKSFEKVALSYGDQILYKVAKNHAWSETWGFGTENADYSIQDDGEYNITFKFNPDAAFDNGFNVDVVVEKIQPVLNSYEVYVANVPEGFGRPYAYVWSMVDGEAVPVAAWPGTRMNMWQFDNGDMGYIFQVQAAEAPQFIIFNNGQGGDGNQTADLEFVNKQTYDLTELMTPPVVEDAVYTITGAVTDHPRYGTEEAGFFGAMWDATVSANDMVKGDDGKYTKTFENVYVNPPYYILYQVVKNQTEAIGEKATFTAETGGMYNVVFTFNPEDNSVTCELQSNVEPEPVYTLVGGVNTTEGGQEDVLFGTTWEPTLEANDMEKGADGIYTKSFEKVALSYGDQILYKVAKNHAWSETWGFGTENADYSIQDDGEYNITFKFNPDAAFDNGYNVDVVVEKVTPQPQLNTYEVYVANVPEDFGRPYAYVWSMVDGEAVPVKDWPGTRMGMWQFGNGDMGYIFQIEAAEAPQFIIFNNGQGGDGNQTADLEFVNKQTYDLTELLQTSAETGATVITFGNNNPNRDYVTDPFVVSGVTNFEADLKDGTHLLLNHNSEGNPGGKFWNGNIVGEWTNTAAVNAVNEALGTAFVDADFAAGTNLATCDPGPGDAHSFLTLTFANAEKNTLELYASVTGRNGALDNITVTGLTNVIISYAVGSGDGFVEQPTFSPDALGVTLVKIQGYLGEDKQVTVTSTSMAGEASAKNGFQMAAYTITDEVLPVVNVYTLAGNAPFFGTEWDVDNADNDMVKGADGVYTKTYENVSFDDQYTIEYKVVKNHSWDENWGFTFNGENADYVIEKAGVYNLTFKFVPEGTLAENDLSVTCIAECLTATGISNVNRSDNDERVYNLQGVRVENPKKGIYIMNGKKIVVK